MFFRSSNTFSHHLRKVQAKWSGVEKSFHAVNLSRQGEGLASKSPSWDSLNSYTVKLQAFREALVDAQIYAHDRHPFLVGAKVGKIAASLTPVMLSFMSCESFFGWGKTRYQEFESELSNTRLAIAEAVGLARMADDLDCPTVDSEKIPVNITLTELVLAVQDAAAEVGRSRVEICMNRLALDPPPTQEQLLRFLATVEKFFNSLTDAQLGTHTSYAAVFKLLRQADRQFQRVQTDFLSDYGNFRFQENLLSFSHSFERYLGIVCETLAQASGAAQAFAAPAQK